MECLCILRLYRNFCPVITFCTSDTSQFRLMKTRLITPGFLLFLMFLLPGSGPVFSRTASLPEETLLKLQVQINGVLLQDSLYYRVTSPGEGVEARKFMELVGGSFHPLSQVFHQKGFMVQYGRFISFAGYENPLGFINCRMVRMNPPATTIPLGQEQVYFVPVPFLAAAIGGEVNYHAASARLEVVVAPPSAFGSVFPPAREVALALADSGFTVQQAAINKLNPVELCLARYTPNANGNNAAFPYLGIQIPPAPGRDSIYYIPITFTLEEDEAVVMVGKTPPECLYFSYRSYLMNRLYTFPAPVSRTKINASLGDAQSLYRMRPDLPVDSMFRRKFALIMTADSLVAMRIKKAILVATPEIAEKDIVLDIVPYGIFRFGNRPAGDWASFLHRASLFKNPRDEESYMLNPSLEIMRVTPLQSSPRVFFKTPSYLSRRSGINEFGLIPDLELLEKGIYNAWHQTHTITWLQPIPWVIEGYTAIQQGADALGDVHDALYISTPDFILGKDDKALVYGVNHTKTGQAVYTNVTIYGSKYLNGLGGMTIFEMKGSARPYMADTVRADRFFTYTLARHPIPGNPFVYVVPADTNKNLGGINPGDSAFIGFRLYVNSVTKIGPDPMEVILDRAILLRPRSTGIRELTVEKPYADLKLYPNPVRDHTTLELTLPAWSEVTLTLYNASGQPVGQEMVLDHVRGCVLQEIRLSEDLPAGIYFLKAVIREMENPIPAVVTSRLLFTGGRGG